MRHQHSLCILLLVLCAAATPSARAFLVFNESRDQVFINASVSFGYNTNVFDRKIAQGSTSATLAYSANYIRRAGVISVNATAAFTYDQFANVKGQNILDPDLSLILTKGVGRTTGSWMIEAQRESAPDPEANNRPISWNYTTALNLRYPVNDRYYLTSATDFSDVVYDNRTLFSDLSTVSEDLGINYIFDSKLDLVGGYRARISDTSGISENDQSFIFGANGTILPKLSGTFSIGAERSDSDSKGVGDAVYDDITSSINLNWRYSRILTFNGFVSRDFSISATDIQTDTTSVGARMDASLGHRWRTNAGITHVGTDFLGAAGDGRRDSLWEFNANVGTGITTHIRVNLGYLYEINYSTLSSVEFTDQSITLSLFASY
jgi:hypothetical protein